MQYFDIEIDGKIERDLGARSLKEAKNYASFRSRRIVKRWITTTIYSKVYLGYKVYDKNGNILYESAPYESRKSGVEVRELD